MATEDIIDARRNYLVNFDSRTVYKIMSKDPIGRASDNIPVYKVAYSVFQDMYNERKFVYHEFLSVKRVNYREGYSIIPLAKLYSEIFTGNKALPSDHKNLMPVDAHFVDKETEDLCVVMPFAERGSLRSIIADKFPYGFPEIFISVALRSVLKALCFLHEAKILHRDVNAGHVYVKSGPLIMLGFAATVYEHGVFNVECSSYSALPATKISNWAAAPEVYNAGNENQYTEKADIWLVGITALELAYGGIRVPNREALDMLIREIIETRKLPKKYQVEERKEETEEEKNDKGKKIMEKTERLDLEERSFSREFEKIVAECLAWNPGDRPTARALLTHDFFRKNGLKRSMLKSHFQGVAIKKIEMSKIKASPRGVKRRRPESHISIPGPASIDEALNLDLNFTNLDLNFTNLGLNFTDRDLNFTNPDLSFTNSSHASSEVPLKLRFKRTNREQWSLERLRGKPEDLPDPKRRKRNVRHPKLDLNMGVETLGEITDKEREDSAKAANEVEGSSPSFSSWIDEDVLEVEVSSSSSLCPQTDYLVDPEFLVVYQIMSKDPIGTASDNLPVYRVAYSECEDNPYKRKFVYNDFVSAKIVNSYRNGEAYTKLKHEFETRNRALPCDHENLMQVEASFVDLKSWDFCVVMPFAEWGSLRSIMADYFPHGFPEICISVALRSVIQALCFLHGLHVFHGDINAGHVYVQSGPKIKLGFAATVYEHQASNLECSSSSTLPETEISNWAAAPEVYNAGNKNHYTEKADIWLVGIMALELAYGGIRVPNREALEMMIREIIEKKRLSRKYPANKQTEKEEEDKGKKIMDLPEKPGSEERAFSREFEKLVVECLAWNPGERPTAPTLLQHKFFMENGIERSRLDSHFEHVVVERAKR